MGKPELLQPLPLPKRTEESRLAGGAVFALWLLTEERKRKILIVSECFWEFHFEKKQKQSSALRLFAEGIGRFGCLALLLDLPHIG